jgi:hypothetical protein
VVSCKGREWVQGGGGGWFKVASCEGSLSKLRGNAAAQANANELFDGSRKFGGAPIIEIGGRAAVGAGLLDQIANEVLGVVAERVIGLSAEGVEHVAGPGLESLLVEANLAVLDDVSACSTLTGL